MIRGVEEELQVKTEEVKKTRANYKKLVTNLTHAQHLGKRWCKLRAAQMQKG